LSTKLFGLSLSKFTRWDSEGLRKCFIVPQQPRVQPKLEPAERKTAGFRQTLLLFKDAITTSRVLLVLPSGRRDLTDSELREL
jgi:hypothetical protein